MEEKKIMAFKDIDGNKIEFEVVAEIYLDEETENEKKYLLLSPVEDGKEEDMFAFRVDITENGEEFNMVEDDAEFNEVKKVYKDLLY
ncbi:DUF1292 domain-containing protein [uncultured Clostridium sp.]|jgi:uncharacterized protein YrzB (UPF0473 family)|uniref:DUF1292 domain-containing protein n=1 Tax=uncultured Clostridium sp. TaxID=59620 RepID=UPI002637B3FC|nr:DUF1292 domain-containing protein [uncultured Clostridium sp.]